MNRETEQWIQQYLDDEISRECFQQLQDALRADDVARRALYQHVRLKRLIRLENSVLAGAPREPLPVLLSPHRKPQRAPLRVLAIAAALAALAVVGFLVLMGAEKPEIRVTGSPNSSWEIDGIAGVRSIRPGQRLDVRSGIVSLEYPTGTKVSGQAPVELEVKEERTIRVIRGDAFFDVAEADYGFVVTTPRARFVDLGTRFGVSSGKEQGDELHVTDGKVRLELPDRQPEITDRTAIGISGSGSPPTPIRYEGFRFAAGTAADHSYVHWAFDEPDGALECTAKGTAPGIEGFGGLIATLDGSSARAQRVSGAFGSALKFNGKDFVNTGYPGVGGGAPRTVAFWYRDPDAHGPLLEDPYRDEPLVMWGYPGGEENLQFWQVIVRRQPADTSHPENSFRFLTYPTGRIRTSERDEATWLSSNNLPLDTGWHHYASVYTGSQDNGSPGQLFHYRDGQLIDGMRPLFPPVTPTVLQPVDRLQPVRIGSYWGFLSSNDTARVEGEIDEVFIVHAALSAEEIKRLMRENQL